MTKQRFIKLMMSKGISRDKAQGLTKMATSRKSYETLYHDICITLSSMDNLVKISTSVFQWAVEKIGQIAQWLIAWAVEKVQQIAQDIVACFYQRRDNHKALEEIIV